MKRKLAVFLILLVVLPLALLAWGAWQRLQDEQSLEQMQQTEIATLRLEQVSTRIDNYLNNLALAWQLDSRAWSLTPEALRRQVQQDGRLTGIFVLNQQGQRQFPPTFDLTQAEQRLVIQLQPVWHDPHILTNHQLNQTKSHQERVNRNSKLSSYNGTQEVEQGWAAWYWEDGMQLVYWSKYPTGETIGLVLNTTRLKADLIGALDVQDLSDASIFLKDEAGELLYQWGSYVPQKEVFVSSHLLAYPLNTWQLQYQTTNIGVQSSFWLLVGSFIGVAILLMSMAYLLYREQTREMRLASQRVQFVSQVSHELKTPLTNIRMYAEMLEDQLDEEPHQQRYLRVISNESQRLSRLIANVLSFSRPMQVHKRAVVIDDVIEQALANCRPSLEAQQFQFHIHLNAPAVIKTDSDAVEQIVINLLSNVEKYARDGRQLDVITMQDTKQTLVRVRDYGQGIPKREQQRIFEPFYRVRNDLCEGVTGTGIGLTIAYQLAQQLGGYLQLNKVERGSCFELVLIHEKE